MSLYYTLDEFTETLQKEVAHLNTYIRMLRYIKGQETFHLKAGIKATPQIKTALESLLVDADTNLAEIETSLTVGSNAEVDFSKYALEIRAGFGGYSLGSIINAADAQPPTTWTLLSRHRDGSLFSAFGSLLVAGDVVEIFGVGDTDYEGFFTITARSTTLFSVEEAEHLISGATVDPIYNVVTRLRERT